LRELEAWNSLTNEPAALAALRAYRLKPECEEALFAYCRYLQEYDCHTNLVANSTLPVLLKEHVLDSLQLVSWIEPGKEHSTRLIDIGSGAGFPGLVLAIVLPALKVTLVESIGKKCRFLENTVINLGLTERVKILCGRAETLGHDKKLRERFNFATARAVGALPLVAELCLPFLQTGGLLLAQRSRRQALAEQAEIDAYASRLGATLTNTIHFDSDLLGRELSCFLIKKLRHMPHCYPRTAAQMKREFF
jgi:16S rRNA (guanine527-N7)-methyltransferase